MDNELPPLKPKQLLRLLELDGWTVGRRDTPEGVFLWKQFPEGKRTTTLPMKHKRALSDYVVGAVLSSKQTGIGRAHLLELIKKARAEIERR